MILTGERAGRIEFIPRITISINNEYSFTLNRHQFPVKLAFAMTINKSQGQTFELLGIDLRTECFSHGQFYVALSRVRSFDGLKIKLHIENTDRKVKNVVYRAMLF
jgi:ATP-dependent exoDNAse (exonuclease V) alpha subunit